MEGNRPALILVLSGHCLKELRKTTINLSKDSRCIGRYSNRIPPDYKSEVLSLQQTYSECASTSSSVKIICAKLQEMYAY
jgi:hypothetical protein